MASREGKIWRCAAKHEHTHEAEVCRRVHSSARQWWEREPGYFYTEELPAERSKPASLPKVDDIRNWAAIWHEQYREIQRRPVVVEYPDRDELLGALRALALQWAPNGNGARHAA